MIMHLILSNSDNAIAESSCIIHTDDIDAS